MTDTDDMPTTLDEALEVLARYGYVPRRDNTRGMPARQRAEIKAACRIVARAPAQPTPAPAPEDG